MIEGSREDYLMGIDMAGSGSDVSYDDTIGEWQSTLKMERDIDDDALELELEPEEVVDDKLYLTDLELANVNLNSERFRVFEANKKLVDASIKMINMQEEMVKLQMEILMKDRQITQYHAQQNNTAFQEFKDYSKQYLLAISGKHDALEGKTWGYNPESGEIVVNE